MKRHSRQEVVEARERNVARWQRYAREFVEMPGRSIQPGEWWSQYGRFNKLTMSCRDHAICRLARDERRFRTHKRAYYKRLDVADFEDS